MGGTNITITKEFTCRSTDKGKDPTGLGRWTWYKISGRNEHHLRVISAYRPQKQGIGPTTIVQQQERYLRSHDIQRTPVQQFDIDILKFLRECLDKGEQVILGMDANEDITNGTIHRKLVEIGMREVITERHRENTPPPSTYSRGNTPIDGIWCSHGITPIKAGYSTFHEHYNSDHRLLWIDIPTEEAFGHRPPGIHEVQARRLQPKDPRNRKKYIKLTLEGFQKQGIQQMVQDLREKANVILQQMNHSSH